MRHRGPDHAGLYRHRTPDGRHVALLHSRLSIIDLDPRANQPFNVNTKWRAYNGELYNYVEVKGDLVSRGHTFATTSDTEVFLRAIDTRGWGALDQCEGMWALAVYDEADGSLTLCRDRFGEKPLYLFRDDSGLYFGSEIKFITALLGRRLDINVDHLYRYLVNGYKALYKKPHGFFRGVTEVPPASVLVLDGQGRESVRAYWQPRFAPDERMSFEDAVAGTRERLIRSVELRLRADVPLAFCMSGGVDSNALISIAKNVFRYDVHGFTIVNTDARYDEQDMVEFAVRTQGLRHTPIPVETKDFLPRLRALVRAHDAPVCTITYYAHGMLMQSIHAHGYRISVSGTAADELFSGYYDHHLAYLYEIREDALLRDASIRAWREHIKPVVRNPFLGDPDLFVRDPGFRDHIFLDAEGFAAFLKHPWAEPFAESRYTDSLLRNRMLNEMFHEAVPVILHEDDLNAMYYSIENRSPFLDRALFEHSFSIPTRHLIRDGRAKAVLREAVRGIAPDAILDNRRKVGFNAPIYSYLDVHDAAVRDEVLGPSPVYDHIRREMIEDLILKPDLPNSQSKFLFYFLNCKMFLEEFAA
jgi:asparagine synthase (glutamine-hydrolysing)